MADMSVQVRRAMNPGVVAIADRREKKAADGWPGSKTIHHRKKFAKIHLEIAEDHNPRAMFRSPHGWSVAG